MPVDFADIRPSVLNWMVSGLMAVTFILFWKWIFTRYQVPGFSTAFASI